MKVICLTGGIASGKSTAARFLGDKGAHVIDADKLGHKAYEPGTQAYRQVLDTFGQDLAGADGQLDRRALGGKVFGKPEEMKKLTDIVWPEIRRMAEAEIGEFGAANADGVAVLEAAVLFEAGWEDIGDTVWVTIVDREVAIERCVVRDGFEREAVESRIDSQLSNEERTAKAQVVIENNGDENGLLAQLEARWQELTA